MKKENSTHHNYTLAINSSLIVISTTIIVTILHELSHYIVALNLSLHPTLYHNHVSFKVEGVPTLKTVFVASAGPIFNLIIGVLSIILSAKLKRVSLFKLFMLWFGMNSLVMFMGYWLIAPFAQNGDTGLVLNFFGVPVFVMILIAIITFILIRKIFARLSNQFIFYKSSPVFNQNDNSKQLFLIPIIISIIFITLLNFPIATWMSILPTVFVPMTYLATYKQYRKQNLNDAEFYLSKLSVSLVIITIIAIGIFIYLKP